MKRILFCLVFLSLASAVFAQSKTSAGAGSTSSQEVFVISGKVLDEQGAPVLGAAVVEKGASNGSITDLNGNYSIRLSHACSLECQCIGYQSQTVAVNAKMTNVNFTLKPSAEFLDEVVVVGYGTLKRSMVTSAITKVKMDEEKMRDVTSPAALLNGRVAGVVTTSGSGNLGAGERMTIRGASSLSAGNDPLYVIDGVPITNSNANLTDFGEDMSSLAVLNLTDIESIEVLKDAASAAIYGSRASNGVIVITTKSGKEGASSVRANFSTGISWFPNMYKVRPANSAEYLEAYNEGVDNYNRQYGLKVGDSGYKVHMYNPFGTQEDIDWMDAITQIANQYNADVAISGGSKKTNYYVGANYNYKEGIIKTNSLEKLNFKVKVTHDATSWLQVGANASANYMKNHQVPGANAGTMIIGRALMQRPFDRIYKPNGDYYVGGTDELTFHNPIQVLNEEVSYIENLRYIGQYFVNFKFMDNKIQFKNTLNTDITQMYDYTYYNESHPYTAKGITDRNQTTKNINTESVISYVDSFLGGDLNLNAMVGHTFQKVDVRNINLQTAGFPSPSFDVVGVGSEVLAYSGNAYAYALESYFGRINAGYKDRYIVTATLRTDGSSKFQPEYRWGWFPSISFGWNVTKEPWVNIPDSDIKLRLSYGKTGNQEGIGTFASQAQMAGGKNYNGEGGIYSTSLGNSKLTWEKADQYDFGTDMSFFKDKLNIIFDAYYKRTTDLLYGMPIYGTSGVTSITSNIGSMENRGVELTIGGDLDLGPVHWSSSFNIARNENKLLSLNGDEGIDPISFGANRCLQIGQELGAFYLFKHMGIFQYDAEVPASLYALGIRAGDIRWDDKNEDGVIDDNDRHVIGSPHPDFFGGFNNTFSWKGLSLAIFFTYSYGNDVYWGQGPNFTKLSHKDGILRESVVNRWTGPGTTNVWPRALNGDTNNTRNSDFYLYDGSYLRLRSLTLSYNFPRKMISKIGMKGLRSYVQGDNLFILTRYPGWDPEVSTNMLANMIGVDNWNVPQPRTISCGLNLTF